MLRPTKILVPTDFSESSDKALKQGIDIARQYNAELHLLHVIPAELAYSVSDYAIPLQAIEALEKQQVEGAFQSMKKQVAGNEGCEDVTISLDIARGIAYEEILRQATENGIDLIVIASLGRSGLAKYFVGSVARNVLKKARCPVLLTK
ncbi:MAG: universal stress protein [Syntrophorhabdaceae bacterium]|nr:universal stress protein [Syntrophorhabdaceae bacterium]MDD4195966.1 universal stress protein [Syntrophorhabdaceae bacterium]